MGITTSIGEWIDGIFEKASECCSERPTIKGVSLAFFSGFLDGLAAWWAIFGMIFTPLYYLCWIISKIQNLFSKKS